jgi:hypothetical protein
MSQENRFGIRVSPDEARVEVWSDWPPVFEPSGWKTELRDGIRAAVQRLRSSPDQMLDAYYYCREHNNADAENALFYSIGASHFRAADSSAIRFTRAFADPPLAPGRRRRPVYLRYHVAPLEARSRKG